MAERAILVRIVTLKAGVILVQQRSALDAGYVVVVVAILAQGSGFRPGVIAGPDTTIAVGTGNGIVGHGIPSNNLIFSDK